MREAGEVTYSLEDVIERELVEYEKTLGKRLDFL